MNKKNLFVFIVALTLISCTKNEKENPSLSELNILTWEGYADHEFVSAFEAENKVKVNVSYVDNDDQLWQKISNDNAYDVIAANTAEIARFKKHDLLGEIDLSKIDNRNNQSERFKRLDDIAGLASDNKYFGIPYAYSEMGLIYNKDIVKTPPTTMGAMWDKLYKGKVLPFDTYQHNFTVAALLLGMKDPFILSDEELKKVAKKLVELSQNSLSFYTSIGRC